MLINVIHWFLAIFGLASLQNLEVVNSQRISKTYEDDDEFRAIVMGDWGGIGFTPYVSPFEVRTGGSMAALAKRTNSQAVFAVGDNFYWNGVTDENDIRFQKTFEDVFHQDSLVNIPWYILAGNHDHHGNVTGQIAYSSHSTRWNFINLWYAVEHQFPTFRVEVIMIDTVTLCGNTYFDLDGSAPQGPDDMEMVDKQLAFITDTMAASTAEYLIVMGHFPVYSIAEHGPTTCLIDQLKPLLEKYQASAYFCGHDHNLQHIYESNVNYFVSGAVDIVDPSTKHEADIPAGSLVYHWGNILGLGGYATVTANNLTMVVEFHEAIDNGLTVLHSSGDINRRKI